MDVVDEKGHRTFVRHILQEFYQREYPMPHCFLAADGVPGCRGVAGRE